MERRVAVFKKIIKGAGLIKGFYLINQFVLINIKYAVFSEKKAILLGFYSSSFLRSISGFAAKMLNIGKVAAPKAAASAPAVVVNKSGIL